jgi:hypothetical protein
MTAMVQCDRCRAVVERWTCLERSERVSGLDITSYNTRIKTDLCPTCSRAFQWFMSGADAR